MGQNMTRDLTPLEQAVLDALRSVKDPDLQKDIVTLNFVKDLKVDNGVASFTIELTTPACPVKKEMEEWARNAVLRVAGIREAQIQMTAAVSTGATAGKESIAGVKNIVAVGSGKGGVGKTTVTVNLAIALARSGAAVGLLDADIYGPNVPLMMGIAGRPHAVDNRIQPLSNYGVRVMSMGFLTNNDDTPLIWRGPMLHSVIQQFIRQVDWGELDYLLIDLPPGTGDVQLSITQTVPLMGAVVVSTPQDVALQDARKAIMMFRQVRVEILGVVENMSYFECPHCNERTHIFSHGGGAVTANRFEVPFLGEVPLAVNLREAGDRGKPVVAGDPDSPCARAFVQIAEKVASQISIANRNNVNTVIIE
jgi:ATP-binding protein involved in chromosome partitioning